MNCFFYYWRIAKWPEEQEEEPVFTMLVITSARTTTNQHSKALIARDTEGESSIDIQLRIICEHARLTIRISMYKYLFNAHLSLTSTHIIYLCLRASSKIQYHCTKFLHRAMGNRRCSLVSIGKRIRCFTTVSLPNGHAKTINEYSRTKTSTLLYHVLFHVLIFECVVWTLFTDVIPQRLQPRCPFVPK